MVNVAEDPTHANYQTAYSYDALKNLLQVQAVQGSQTRSFGYNSYGWLTQASNPENGTINYTYDGNGNVLTKQNARGTTCYGNYSSGTCDGLGYDELNRVLFRTYSDSSTVRAAYAYDGYSPAFGDSCPGAVGHLTGSWSVNPDGTVVAANEGCNFDPMGRPWAEKQCTPATCGLTPYSLTMSYNFLGDETSYSDGAYSRSTGYDTTDRLNSFNVNNQSLLSNPQYYPYGLKQVTLGNGLTENRNYDPNRLWLTSIQVGSTGNPTSADSLGLGYYTNGNIYTANDSVNGNWTYGYDYLNRLQSAMATGHNFQYTDDRYGNMTCGDSGSLHSPCTPLGMTFDSTTNRISDGVRQYDGNVSGGPGNLTADGTNGYVYDLENRIACVGTDQYGNCTPSNRRIIFTMRKGAAWGNSSTTRWRITSTTRRGISHRSTRTVVPAPSARKSTRRKAATWLPRTPAPSTARCSSTTPTGWAPNASEPIPQARPANGVRTHLTA